MNIREVKDCDFPLFETDELEKKILREVLSCLSYIKDDYFLCNRIGKYVMAHPHMKGDARLLLRKIHESLEGTDTLSDFFCTICGYEEEDAEIKLYHELRVRWINLLLEYKG